MARMYQGPYINPIPVAFLSMCVLRTRCMVCSVLPYREAVWPSLDWL